MSLSVRKIDTRKSLEALDPRSSSGDRLDVEELDSSLVPPRQFVPKGDAGRVSTHPLSDKDKVLRKLADSMAAAPNSVENDGLPNADGVAQQLPDNAELFAHAQSRLKELGFSLSTISAEDLQKIDRNLLRVIASSEEVGRVLGTIKKHHPGVGTLYFSDLERIAMVDGNVDATSWLEEFAALIPDGNKLGESGIGYSVSDDVPFDLVVKIAGTRDGKKVLEFFKEYRALASFKLLKVILDKGYSRSIAPLNKFVKGEYCRIMLREFRVTSIKPDDVVCTAFPSSSSWSYTFEQEFIEGVKKILSASDQLGDFRKPDNVHDLYGIYCISQGLFRKFSKLPADILKIYSEYNGAFADSTTIVDLNGDKITINSFIYAIAAMLNEDEKLPEMFARSLRHLGMNLPQNNSDHNGMLVLLSASLKSYEQTGVVASEEFAQWYNSASDDGILPKPKWHSIKSDMACLVKIFRNKDAFEKLSQLGIQFEYLHLSEIFESDILVNLLKDDTSIRRIVDVMNKKDVFSPQLFIRYMKFVALGGDLTTLDSVAKAGLEVVYDNPLLMVPLKEREYILRSQVFGRFAEYAVKELLHNERVDKADLMYLSEIFISGIGEKEDVVRRLKEDDRSEWSALDEKIRGILESEKFSSIVESLVSKFKVRNSELLASALYLYQSGVPMDDIYKISDQLGREVKLNDIGLLVAIAQDEELGRLVGDRKALVSKVKSAMVGNPAVLRSYEKTPYYNERPDIDNFDNAFLIRAYIMLRMMADDAVLSEVDTMVERDILDTRTEHGGVIIYDPQRRRFLFKDITSTSFSDGSYLKSRHDPTGMVFIFHFHALSDDQREFAGPSWGTIWSDGADDLSSSRRGGQTGLVVTPCGREKEKLILNFDIYEGSSNGDKVLDLGTRKASAK
ncbi:MAG: hypothetical protein GX659_04280 [Myxococcales bacterium]|mgnify:CR=1 FL=1|nr:hypothetical protein [Myxococcales bacterium]